MFGPKLSQPRGTMRTGALLGGVMALLVASTAGDPAAAKVPRAMAGKVFFSTGPVPDQEEAALIKQFSKRKPRTTLTRPKTKPTADPTDALKSKESAWKTTIVAFFRKPSVDGPITIWIYDSKDRKGKDPVHVASINAKGASQYFVHELTLDPDLGFNRKRSYVIRVGQIIAKKVKIYAMGRVTLR